METRSSERFLLNYTVRDPGVYVRTLKWYLKMYFICKNMSSWVSH